MSVKNHKTTVLNFKTPLQLLSYLEGLKLLPNASNRKVKASHAKKMAKSIEAYGLLRAVIAIKTKCYDEIATIYVGDGQHLREALLKYVDPKKIRGILSIAIVEIDKKSDVIPLISGLNSTASNWTMLNYLDSWCADGKKDYI